MRLEVEHIIYIYLKVSQRHFKTLLPSDLVWATMLFV